MPTIKEVNLFGDSYKVFDTIYPVGFVYTQYPGQKNPKEMWGEYSEWEKLDYGGAFFRSAGGNADVFEKTLKIDIITGATIKFTENHGLAAESIVYDYEHNESRVVSRVTDSKTIVLKNSFSSIDITNVYITQLQGTAKNGFWLNSDSSGTGTANKTTNNGGHDHSYTASNDNNNSHMGGHGGTNNSGTHGATTGSNGSHAHNIYFGSSDKETRSNNYSYILWKRTN